MAAPPTMSGARAKVYVHKKDSAGKQSFQLVGIWNHFSYGVNYDVQTTYVLGRFSPASIEYTGVEPVSITAGGWRPINHGPHVDGALPNIKDLLTHEYILLQVFDRATGVAMANISGCRPTGYSTGLTSKQLMESTNTYMGMLCGDESEDNQEAADAVPAF